ncbi:MAG: BsuBI/PstI family type II restriction endonuclease, partial [Chloroflexota bacterium]
TEGPVDAARVVDIRAWLSRQGFSPDDAYFVTAYHDRASTGYRATMSQIAWGTFVWFESEADHLLIMSYDGAEQKLRELSHLVARQNS